jgi:SPP1 gp7 family putative phage head morphogenesis protein
MRHTPDPTRTLALRRRFAALLRGRLARLRRALLALLQPPVQTHARSQADERTLLAQVAQLVEQAITAPRRWWQAIVLQGYDAGARQAASAVRRQADAPTDVVPRQRGFLPTEGLSHVLDGVAGYLGVLWHSVMIAVSDALRRTATRAPRAEAAAVRQAMAPFVARATAVAETAIVAAHATGTLDTLQAAGVRQVRLDPEVRYTTAGDRRVCPRCRAWSGRIVPVAQAYGIIPRHRHCRCAWIPVVRREAA